MPLVLTEEAKEQIRGLFLSESRLYRTLELTEDNIAILAANHAIRLLENPQNAWFKLTKPRLVFKNVYTGDRVAVALKPADMSDERFVAVAYACSECNKHLVEADLCAIKAANPVQTDCWLAVEMVDA